MRAAMPRILCLVLLLVAATHPAAQAAGSCSISGVVSTASGEPAASVWVTLLRDGARKGRSLSGDDGSYYIAGLDSGSYEIVVEDDGKVLYTGRVKLPNDKAHDIRLSR